jgi:CHAD domain-containing protein
VSRIRLIGMREHVERELKLSAPSDFQLPELGGTPLPDRSFVSTYHDTKDLRLARHGVTFRHRVEDGSGVWQLKLPRAASRTELEEHGPPARPPEHLLALLAAVLRDEPLVRVARLRTRRRSIRADGAEIVDDSVAVLEGQRVAARFRELEVELLEGDERTLRRLEHVLREAGAEPGVFEPKLFRVLELAYPPEPVETSPDATPGEALGAALHAQYERLLAHDPGTRLGADPEDLHQMRVATRRTRAFLRTGRPLLDPEWARELRAELGWLGSALGPARDLDVLSAHLRAEIAALGEIGTRADGLRDAVERERVGARSTAVAALSEDRYFALLDRLQEAARPPLAERAKHSLGDLWWKEFKRTRHFFAGLGPDSDDAELHTGRIRVKRARYAAELALHELGPAGGRFVGAAKKLQDLLGAHQDAVVAERKIVAWAGDGDVTGVLVERERARRREARREWPTAWEKLERRGRAAKP